MMINNIIDYILGLIETYSSKINGWAWDQRWKEPASTRQTEWVKGYNSWKNGSKEKAMEKAEVRH